MTTPTDEVAEALAEIEADLIQSAHNEYTFADIYPSEKRKLERDLKWISEKCAIIRAALTAPGMKWQTIDSAPKDGTEIEVRIGRMIFPAKWEHGFLDDNEKDCGGWVATEENHHPACWTSGVCWQTNEDGQLSEQPEYWRLPAPPAAK